MPVVTGTIDNPTGGTNVYQVNRGQLSGGAGGTTGDREITVLPATMLYLLLILRLGQTPISAVELSLKSWPMKEAIHLVWASARRGNVRRLDVLCWDQWHVQIAPVLLLIITVLTGHLDPPHVTMGRHKK